MKRVLYSFILGVLLSPSLLLAQGGVEDADFYAKSWAVVIGINEYQNRQYNLEYAVNDAEAVAVRFEQMGFEEVISVIDEEATRENILHLLTVELPQQVGENDRLVIFYAGHGATGQLLNRNDWLNGQDRVGFLVPHDAVFDFDIIDGDAIAIESYQSFLQNTNFISLDDLRNVSDTILAKHILYILDGCYSGFLDPAAYKFRSARRTAFVGDATGASDGTQRGLQVDVPSLSVNESQRAIGTSDKNFGPINEEKKLASRPTVQVLTAGSSGEPVVEKGGHGIFTYYLLRTLDGFVDDNANCVVRTSEMAYYLREVVPNASRGQQTPLFGRISGEGDMIFVPPICNPLKEKDLKPPAADKNWQKVAAYKAKRQGGYKEPAQVVVDQSQNLYVLDSKLKKIFKFDKQGNFLSDSFDLPEDGKKWEAHSMTVRANGDLWVFYSPSKKQKGPGKIFVFQADGSPGETWAGDVAIDSCDFGERPFPAQALIALDREDNLLLVDQQKEFQMKCDSSGMFLHQKGAEGDYARFKSPQGLAVDNFDYVYISNTGGNGVQKFFDGKWIKTRWPQLEGSKELYFKRPHGLAVDNRLFVYVADTENHRIKKYTNKGEKLLAYWGKKKAKKGGKYGEFKEPQDVAVSPDGRYVYVADTGNKRIQRFVNQ